MLDRVSCFEFRIQQCEQSRRKFIRLGAKFRWDRHGMKFESLSQMKETGDRSQESADFCSFLTPGSQTLAGVSPAVIIAPEVFVPVEIAAFAMFHDHMTSLPIPVDEHVVRPWAWRHVSGSNVSRSSVSGSRIYRSRAPESNADRNNWGGE